MIDLAYSSLLLNSRELAEEVQALEGRMDTLHTEFELLVVSSGFKPEETKDSPELQSPTNESKPEDTSPVKKPEDTSINTDSTEDIKTDNINKKIERDDIPSDIDEPIIEELKAKDLKTLEEEKDKAIIVEADADAIDAALKKRTKKDESLIEADEQTIIDKVLSQKKKGRWSSK